MRTKTANPELKKVRFDNSRLTALGIELLFWSELRNKLPLTWFQQPERIDFFMLMLVTEGSGRHTVDFVEWPLLAGSLIFVRPGQVQQWHVEENLEAHLIVIAPSTLPHHGGLSLVRELELLALDEWSTSMTLDTAIMQVVVASIQQMRLDFNQFSGEDLEVALIRHQLLTLLLRIAKWSRQSQANLAITSVSRLTYRLFIQTVETRFAQEHSLQYYAKKMGYSESTISRACIAMEGRSAKKIIDRRIVIEAQRLLVHSTISIAEVAYQLGFSEATNFVKFFRRQIGQSPSQFRLSVLPKVNH